MNNKSVTNEKILSKQTSKTVDKAKKRKEAEQRNRNYKQNKEVLNQLKVVEEKIKILEENKLQIEKQLCNPVVLKDSEKIKPLMLDLKEYNHELIALKKTRKEFSLKIK